MSLRADAGSFGVDPRETISSPRSPLSSSGPWSPRWKGIPRDERIRLQIEEWQAKISAADGTPLEDRAELWHALERKKKGFERMSFGQRLADELFITGAWIFDRFKAKPRRHVQYWTWIFFFIVTVIYFFMTGVYSSYVLQNRPDLLDTWGTSVKRTSPQSLLETIVEQPAWRSFDAQFIRVWGGRDGLLLKKQYHRWITSLFIHGSFQHYLANMLLWLSLGHFLEHKYASWRVLLLWVLSGVGGNLFSLLFENPCNIVIGASGSIFGLMGLYIADVVLNFETIKRPVLRVAVTLLFLIFFVVQASTDKMTSHLSHLGGLLVGIFPSFLYLPNFAKWTRWETALLPIGAIVVIVVFIVFPIIVYTHRLKDLTCG